MTITTFTSRDFARDATAVKRATAHGPVFITDRGKPALAVLDIEEYYRLTGGQQPPSLLNAMMAIPGGGGIELELPQRRAASPGNRIPDFASDAESSLT